MLVKYLRITDYEFSKRGNLTWLKVALKPCTKKVTTTYLRTDQPNEVTASVTTHMSNMSQILVNKEDSRHNKTLPTGTFTVLTHSFPGT